MKPTLQEIEARCKVVGWCMVWVGTRAGREGRDIRPVWHKTKGQQFSVRRLVLEHRTGEPLPSNRYACCVCPYGHEMCITHLKACTRQEQMLRASANGRLLKGPERTARNAAAQRPIAPKMTMAKAEAMRARRAEGATYHQLGEEFGVHFSMAHRICAGRAWVNYAPPPAITRIPTPPGRFAPDPGFERVISGDWMLRRQGVDIREALKG